MRQVDETDHERITILSSVSEIYTATCGRVTNEQILKSQDVLLIQLFSALICHVLIYVMTPHKCRLPMLLSELAVAQEQVLYSPLAAKQHKQLREVAHIPRSTLFRDL